MNIGTYSNNVINFTDKNGNVRKIYKPLFLAEYATVANFKKLFYCDKVSIGIDTQNRQTINGLVEVGGANAQMRDLSKRKGNAHFTIEMKQYIMLNDGGLNTLGKITENNITTATVKNIAGIIKFIPSYYGISKINLQLFIYNANNEIVGVDYRDITGDYLAIINRNTTQANYSVNIPASFQLKAGDKLYINTEIHNEEGINNIINEVILSRISIKLKYSNKSAEEASIQQEKTYYSNTYPIDVGTLLTNIAGNNVPDGYYVSDDKYYYVKLINGYSRISKIGNVAGFIVDYAAYFGENVGNNINIKIGLAIQLLKPTVFNNVIIKITKNNDILIPTSQTISDVIGEGGEQGKEVLAIFENVDKNTDWDSYNTDWEAFLQYDGATYKLQLIYEEF